MSLLIAIQQNLDGDLNLNQLAAAHRLSPYHFHRVFKTSVGETPMKYVQRLRIEKAAYKLWITEETVIDVGLSVGFRNHETFTRAFRRFFGSSPIQFRADGRTRRRQHLDKQRSWKPEGCNLSTVRFQTLRSMPLLAIRHLGSYFEIPEAFSTSDVLWTRVIRHAERLRIVYQPIAIAIFYDNPWLTPPEAQRTDICVPLVSPIAETEKSFKGERSVRVLQFEGGLYGVIEHMGPYETLRHAFRRLADTIHESKTYRSPEENPGVLSVKSRIGNAAGRSEVWMAVVKAKKTKPKRRET